MLTEAQLCLELKIEREVLDRWIGDGWIVPATEGASGLADIDMARARLILELERDLGVNAAGLGIILDLIDQIHGLRLALRGSLDIRAADERKRISR
jgi:chaperone modulatory protein CbpM